jgi:hypothetical protein
MRRLYEHADRRGGRRRGPCPALIIPLMLLGSMMAGCGSKDASAPAAPVPGVAVPTPAPGAPAPTPAQQAAAQRGAQIGQALAAANRQHPTGN